MHKRVFFQNAAIMTATSLILRAFGILFRIYIGNRIGSEGMGLYQLIISVYTLCSSFASSGLTTAVTRLCADEMVRGTTTSIKRVVKIGAWISAIIGLASAVIVVTGAEYIATTFLKDARAIPSLKMMTVSLPFMGISSCLKGYFLARRKVGCSSFAQILEQTVRIGAIIWILNIQQSSDVTSACFAILLGDAIAEGVSCLFMIINYRLDQLSVNNNDVYESSSKAIIGNIIHIALPITSGRYLNSGLRTVENILVPNMLEVYTHSRSFALSQFGNLKGMALPILFFPSSFLTAFSSLLLPEISQAHTLSQHHQLQRTIHRTLQITLLSSILIGGLFWVLAYPIGALIYDEREIGRMLRVLAPIAPIMYLESVVVGILKGLDQQAHSLVYSVIDSVSRIGLIVAFLPIHGIDGFLGIMVFSNILTCSLNTIRLCRYTHFRLPIVRTVIKPCCAVIISMAISHFADRYMPIPIEDHLAFCLVHGGIVTIVYLTLLMILQCVKREDMIVIKPISDHFSKHKKTQPD